MTSRLTPVCFDPDESLYTTDGPEWDNLDEPEPFAEQCDCGETKDPENDLCDACHDKRGGIDHV